MGKRQYILMTMKRAFSFAGIFIVFSRSSPIWIPDQFEQTASLPGFSLLGGVTGLSN
jgi:hypothetical protein